MVDANAAYSLGDADHLAKLDPFDLMMIEQPLDYDDVSDHARLQRRLRTPSVSTNRIHSVRAAPRCHRGRGCRIVNIKPGRVGGIGETIRLHDLCAERGIPVWHGGMLESGSVAATTSTSRRLPNFSLPGRGREPAVLRPDLIDPPVEVAPDGTIAVPTAPGCGAAIVQERVERATVRVVTLP